MFSKFFIERPIFAGVVAIVTVLLGARVDAARCRSRSIPTSRRPRSTSPPAIPAPVPPPSPNTVGIPIEQQVNGVPGMLYMQSFSASDGTYTLIVTFDVGTDMDTAQTLVYQRVAIAQAELPPQVAAQGVTVKQQSTNVLLFANLISPTGVYDSLFLTNYAAINLQSELARVAGVAEVNVLGAGTYSMRIWLDPQKLQTFGLVPDDVIQALNQQNAQVAAGQTGTPPQPRRPAVPVHHQPAGPARPAGAVRGHRGQGRDRRRRPAGADQRRRPRRAGCADLQHLRQPDRRSPPPASPSTSCRPPTRSTWRQAVKAQDGAS